VADLGDTGRHARLARASIYFICGARPGGRDLSWVLQRALAGTVNVFQLREKDAADDEVLAAAQIARELCRDAGALFILNDRPDLAVAADADGVHLGQDDMRVADARAVVGPERLVGLSTHTPEQIDAARADYIGVGPVHATPTKAGRPAVGLELVRYAAKHAAVPFFAIGGIDAGNVDDVVVAGGERIAVVRALAEADDPRAAAIDLRDRMNRHFGGVLLGHRHGSA
jgi:thiamine-phosphate pyrophosphorylase